MDTRNAVIVSATITANEGAGLSAWLILEYGGSGQAFGAHALYLPAGFAHHDIMSYAGHFIWRVMAIAGVTEWKQLPGKVIRVRYDHSRVSAIGHIIADDWFCPVDDFGWRERTQEA